jgi:hypothetical protein
MASTLSLAQLAAWTLAAPLIVGTVDVRSVDERSSRWQMSFPTYRVYFFDNPHGVRSSWTTYTYEITGAHNVHQVLAWADANARGRTYCVYAVVDQAHDPTAAPGEVGLLQLTGWDPNSPGDPRADAPGEFPPEPEAQRAHLLDSRKRARK